VPAPSSARRATALTLIALFVFSCIPRVHAHHRKHSLPPVTNQSPLSFSAAAHFDGDVRQDRVTLHSNGYDKTISIRFGDLRDTKIGFTTCSFDDGRLVARDIDRDGDVDLVWFGNVDPKAAVVWMNDGEGNFAELTDNSPYASGLDDLFGAGDPSDSHSLKRKRKSSTLASSSFHEVGLHVLPGVQRHTVSIASLPIPRLLNFQSHFAAYLRKRGPPLRLS